MLTEIHMPCLSSGNDALEKIKTKKKKKKRQESWDSEK